jgi:hypothetical protein
MEKITLKQESILIELWYANDTDSRKNAFHILRFKHGITERQATNEFKRLIGKLDNGITLQSKNYKFTPKS